MKYATMVFIALLGISVNAGDSTWAVYTRPGPITAFTQFNHEYHVGTQNKGVIVYRFSRNGVTMAPGKITGLPDPIGQLTHFADSSLWIIGSGAHCIYKNDTCVKDPYLSTVAKLFADNNGNRYCYGVAAGKGISGIHYKRDTGWVSFRQDARSRADVFRTAFDKKNVLYGLYGVYGTNNKTIVSLRKGIPGLHCTADDPLRDTMIIVRDSTNLNSMAFDSSGRLWFGADTANVCYLSDGEIILDSARTAKLAGKRVYSIAFDKSDRMWIVSDTSLICFTDTAVSVFGKSNVPFLKDYTWSFRGLTNSPLTYDIKPSALRNDSGYLSFLFGEIIAWYDESTWNALSPDSFGMLPVSGYNHFRLDSKDTGWIVGSTLRSVYKSWNGEFYSCDWDTAGKSGSITAFLIDKHDHLWFALSNGKLVEYSREDGWKIHATGLSALYSGTKMCFDAKGALWIAAPDQNSSATSIHQWAGDTLHRLFSKNTVPILENTITALASAPDGSMLLGTSAGNLGVIKNDSFCAYTRLKYQLPNSRVSLLYPGKNSGFWIGSDRFLIEFDNGVKRTYEYGKPGGLPVQTVTAALRRNDGKVWLTGQNSLLLFDEESGWETAAPLNNFPYYSTKPGNLNLSFLCEDSQGNLWLQGTDALIKYRPSQLIRVETGRISAAANPAVNRIAVLKTSGFVVRVDCAGAAEVVAQAFLVNGRKIGETKRYFAHGGCYSLPLAFRDNAGASNIVAIVTVRIRTKDGVKSHFVEKVVF